MESPELEVPVYVYGQLSNWKLDPEFELSYNYNKQSGGKLDGLH